MAELTTIARTNDRAMTRPDGLMSTVSPVMVRKNVTAVRAIVSLTARAGP